MSIFTHDPAPVKLGKNFAQRNEKRCVMKLSVLHISRAGNHWTASPLASQITTLVPAMSPFASFHMWARLSALLQGQARPSRPFWRSCGRCCDRSISSGGPWLVFSVLLAQAEKEGRHDAPRERKCFCNASFWGRGVWEVRPFTSATLGA